MEKSDIEKREEVVNEVGNTFRQIIGGFIPGAHVVSSFWNFRSRLKQKRLMDFAEGLRKVFEEEIKKDLSSYNFETEDFVDVFDSVLSKVHETKSEQKLLHFRNILANYIVEPIDNLILNKYVDILHEINEVQLRILPTLPVFERRFDRGVDFGSVIHNITGLKGQELIDAERNGFTIQFGGQNVRVEISDLEFYLNDLVSKGLVVKQQKKAELKNKMDLMEIPEPEFGYLTSKTARDLLEFIELYNPEG